MRSTLARICAVLLPGAALAAGYWTVYLPFRCNRTIAAVEARSNVAITRMDRIEAVPVARQNLEDLEAVRAGCWGDPNLYMLRAINEHLVGRDEDALVDFGHALRVDRRPEIYFDRGMALLALGRVDEALNDLAAGAAFNPFLLDRLDVEMRERVRERMGKNRIPAF